MERIVKATLVTVNDVAEALSVSPKCVRNWARDGRIRAVRLGRQWRVPADEIWRLQREGLVRAVDPQTDSRYPPAP